jgi:ADP-ribose pyrophosphatase YjhB (NUDIX family)
MEEYILSCVDYASLPDRQILFSPFYKKKHISYGVMLWCEPTDSWLLVRSKNSYAFNTFLQGMYRKSDLFNILMNMTYNELQMVRQLYIGTLHWNTVYQGNSSKIAYERFLSIKNSLRPLMAVHQGTSTTNWTFPKGRLEHRETPWYCALREFYEEAGFDMISEGAQCISDTVVMETYTSFNREVYETQCWLFKIDHEVQLTPPVGDEIGERCWVKTADMIKFLSPSKLGMLNVALQHLKIK